MSKPIEIMHRLYGAYDAKTCGECCHLECYQYSRRYYKCTVYGVSCSQSTDWAMRWKACGLLNKDVQNQRPVKDWWRSNNRAIKPLPPQIDGQIEFDLR